MIRCVWYWRTTLHNEPACCVWWYSIRLKHTKWYKKAKPSKLSSPDPTFLLYKRVCFPLLCFAFVVHPIIQSWKNELVHISLSPPPSTLNWSQLCFGECVCADHEQTQQSTHVRRPNPVQCWWPNCMQFQNIEIVFHHQVLNIVHVNKRSFWFLDLSTSFVLIFSQYIHTQWV